MNDPREQQEPSMEEILASIRRIISEDDEGGEGGEEISEASAEEAASEEDPSEEASADDIEAPMADAGPAPAGDNDDVLELTEEVQDDGTVVELDVGREAAEEDEDIEIVAADIEQPAAEPQPESVAKVVEGLVAAPIAAEATSTFAGFASAVDQGRLASSQDIGGRTVEDVVKEVVRPIVKECLDENLAALVEKLVSREIDRMSRRAKDQLPD